MTIAQIYAVVSLLLAFNVPQTDVDYIKTLLMPKQATTTPAFIQSPVTIGTIAESQPLYFGPATPAPVAPAAPAIPADTTPPMTANFSLLMDKLNTDTGVTLVIVADETLDFDKTTLSKGEIGKVTARDRVTENNFGRFKTSQFESVQKQTHGYVANVSGVERLDDVTITIQDLAGNKLTRTLRVY